MSETPRDQQLLALFEQAQTDLSDSDFVHQALRRTQALQKRAKFQRIAFSVLIFVIALLLQDYSLVVSQALMISLIDLPNNFVSTLLAPVNSLGGVLTAVLLCLRLTQKRFYR
ncbi:MAG: hypothetical protein ACFHXK_02530 [bacterium]